MKRMLLLAIAVIMIGASSYAAENNGEPQDSVFQKASDVINGKYEVKTVPYKKITIFQSIADKICSKDHA